MDLTPLTQATLRRAFEPADFEVLWTAKVPAAVEALTQDHMDLLLLDFNRPLTAAWDTFHRLTALSPGARVVLLTERKTVFEVAVAEKMGALLEKPFSAAALALTISVLLGRPSASVASTKTASRTIRKPPEKTGDIRCRLHERYIAPYVLSPSCRHRRIKQ